MGPLARTGEKTNYYERSPCRLNLWLLSAPPGNPSPHTLAASRAAQWSFGAERQNQTKRRKTPCHGRLDERQRSKIQILAAPEEWVPRLKSQIAAADVRLLACLFARLFVRLFVCSFVRLLFCLLVCLFARVLFCVLVRSFVRLID